MSTSAKRKNLYIVLGVLAILLLTGLVFAALTGLLTFSGTAQLNTNVDLDIVSASVVSPKMDDETPIDTATVGPTNATGTSISTNNNTLTFHVEFDDPGESRTIQFSIDNIGNTDAVLKTLSKTEPAENSGVTITWPNLNGVDIARGGTSGPYNIIVTWDATATDVNAGEVTFSATIDYEEAP